MCSAPKAIDHSAQDIVKGRLILNVLPRFFRHDSVQILILKSHLFELFVLSIANSIENQFTNFIALVHVIVHAPIAFDAAMRNSMMSKELD